KAREKNREKERKMYIPSDNVYAYALSKTLTKVSSPVTVGLYSECHNRINVVLKNIECKCALFKAIQDSFGKLQLGLFRIVQHDEEKDAGKKKIEDIPKNWRSKKLGCIPIWALILIGCIGSILILVPLIMFGFPHLKEYLEGEKVEESIGYGALEGFAIAVLGVPVVGALRFILLLLKNLIFNQDLKIRQGLDNKKVSQQLGLMHEVRLDETAEDQGGVGDHQLGSLHTEENHRCFGCYQHSPDEESPFISVLAVDPEVLVRQVQQAEDCLSKKDSAYDFLDRIITLPFTMPPLSNALKSSVFENIVRGQSEISENIPLEETGASALGDPGTSFSVEDEYSVKLCWILQCVEDNQQSDELDGSNRAVDNTKELWEVFNYNSLELCIIGHAVKNFLERDGDLELFEIFLKNHFKFTVEDLEKFKLCTVNLNIKKELSRIRGRHRLKRAGRNAFQSLSSRTVMNMKTEDICQELSNLRFPEKYLETVRENCIDGRMILFSDPKDLRQVLQMTLGEWTSFKIHFLGIIPSSQPAQAKTLPNAINPSGHMPGNGQ
uniref:NTPase, KAP family P-loop domain containing 1 n=1 Tax=Sinocyclocheilus grahami TaxID=75366 RepID=A0A672KDZ0_SINGR